MYTTTGSKPRDTSSKGRTRWRCKSLQTDRSLTAMRVFALSRENLLGEKLFDFPQYNGSQGLLPSLSDTTYAHDWTKALYKHLGGKPGKNLKDNTRFLELLSQRPSATAAAKDYLLCAYLLDKNLDAFVTVLPRCHERQPPVTLQRGSHSI